MEFLRDLPGHYFRYVQKCSVWFGGLKELVFGFYLYLFGDLFAFLSIWMFINGFVYRGTNFFMCSMTFFIRHLLYNGMALPFIVSFANFVIFRSVGHFDLSSAFWKVKVIVFVVITLSIVNTDRGQNKITTMVLYSWIPDETLPHFLVTFLSVLDEI